MLKTSLLIVLSICIVGLLGMRFVTEKPALETMNGEPKDGAPSLQKEAAVIPTETTGALALDLSNQNLTQAPSSLFERTDIEKLDLSHNLITGALQAEMRRLSALRVLDLSDNQFTDVPAEIGQLTDLEVLDLSNNQLTGLPYELGNLSNLKRLDLRGNDYAKTDLEIIKAKLPSSTEILVD